MTSKPRGFAAMTPERRRAIAAMGGRNSGGNFKNSSERAQVAGHAGGKISGGNFKNDRKRAAEAGRKGGLA
jgi:general stress protein YciG